MPFQLGLNLWNTNINPNETKHKYDSKSSKNKKSNDNIANERMIVIGSDNDT